MIQMFDIVETKGSPGVHKQVIAISTYLPLVYTLGRINPQPRTPTVTYAQHVCLVESYELHEARHYLAIAIKAAAPPFRNASLGRAMFSTVRAYLHGASERGVDSLVDVDIVRTAMNDAICRLNRTGVGR